VLHEDGTMAVYAHLQPESVIVRPGQRVNTGQRLGASGNTGFSTGPHLHFALQVNRGMELVSIPFRMDAPNGAVTIPGAQ
jgi:murein DD-endopeptidase MepM/ murein hydrolase activator NlpD